MRTVWLAVLAAGICLSCNNNKNNGPVNANTEPVEKPSFFPVTSYLLGQLHDFRERGINPVHYITVSNHTDSAWLKTEEVETAVKDFLQPVIDSTSMVSLFTETKFKDRSIDSYTFTYDPKTSLPDSMQLQHWDVYIDAQSGKVKKVYLLKKISATRDLQLTWQSDKWCTLVTIENNPDGTSSVIKEEKINWDL